VDVGQELTPSRVAVVGGGYAGLAAAVELADAGIDVTLYEASRTLGGRARRVESNGYALDNGQHLMVGAYSETLRLLRKIGVSVEHKVARRTLQLVFSDGFALSTPTLPSPLHLAWALIRAPLTWRERASGLRFMQALKRCRYRLGQDHSVAALLDAHEQPATLRRHVWEPLCLAAMNTPVNSASAQVFANVLRDSLAGPRTASDLLHPTTDLTELFPEPAAKFIISRRGSIRTNEPIQTVERGKSGFQLLGAAEPDTYSHVILAVAPYHLSPLLAGLPELAPVLRCVGNFSYEPIATAYFAYPVDVRLPIPMLGLTSGHAHWLFDRGQLSKQPGLIAAVISTSGPWQLLSRDALLLEIQAEIERVLGKPAVPLWMQLIVEKRATFACTPGIERPPTRTPVPEVLLAGDYVASDYPATIEAAVRSGIAAARSIIDHAAA
jgi:squalene-associated FAD-dependent desaturase